MRIGVGVEDMVTVLRYVSWFDLGCEVHSRRGFGVVLREVTLPRE